MHTVVFYPLDVCMRSILPITCFFLGILKVREFFLGSVHEFFLYTVSLKAIFSKSPRPPPPSLLVHLCEPIITAKNLIEIFTVVVFQFWRIIQEPFIEKELCVSNRKKLRLYICKCCCT